MMKKILAHTYEDLVSIENLLLAWQEFFKGKKHKKDMQEFDFNLMNNILSLHNNLSSNTYKHGTYEEFNISDPKPRIIHKATVRDRLLHHAVYRVLYSFFDKTFTADSYSCRIGRGTHKTIERFKTLARIVSKNNTKTCWVLKCDIKKFFASIDQNTLTKILNDRIYDKRIIDLLKEIISSFSSGRAGVGLPLGNLTSQLFSNVYMNEFDKFVKHKLKVRQYVRYADDFVILSDDKRELETLLPYVKSFLQDSLQLGLHPDKVFLKRLIRVLIF